MATLFMTIGFPGSGKSTWARGQINDNTVIGRNIVITR